MSSGRFTYRPMEATDFGSVHVVALESWRYAYGAWLSAAYIEESVSANYGTEVLRKVLEGMGRGQTLFLVACDKDRVIGFAHAGDRGEGWELVRLYVHPSYLGVGVGTGLVQRTETFFRSKGAASYFCYAHAANERAIRFYTSRGFFHRPERDREDPPFWYLEKTISPGFSRRKRGGMDSILTMEDMAAIYEVTDDLGIDRESINVELTKEDPGTWGKGVSGMGKREIIEITLPASTALEEWLPKLRAGLQELMES